MNATANNMTVTETQGYERIDRSSGPLDIYRTFSVQREGREAHRVTIRVSGDSGAPQSERCDCRGYQFRGECAHIHAVYAAGVLTCFWPGRIRDGQTGPWLASFTSTSRATEEPTAILLSTTTVSNV